MADDLDLLVERIRALLDAIAEGAGLPRSEVEPTLTDGYARALELDAECLRLEHRIDKLTRRVADGHDVPAGKLSGLLRRLHETEQRTVDLRAVLAPLRELVARAA
jgi:Mg2+ and Co2+ transporter CorA